MKRIKTITIIITILFLASAIGIVMYLAMSIESFKSDMAFLMYIFAYTIVGVVLFFIQLGLTNKALRIGSAYKREADQLQIPNTIHRERNNPNKQQQEINSVKKIDQDLIDEFMIELKTQENLTKLTEKFMSLISRNYNLVQAICFSKDLEKNEFLVVSTFAFYSNESKRKFEYGDGISGQVVKNKKVLEVTNIPDGYVTVLSGLGQSNPRYLLMIPIIHNEESVGLFELAFFAPLKEEERDLITNVAEQISDSFYEHRALTVS